ncbi:hypothetical protein EVAR_64601_1 [Eumeta japonica]|uniref:Histone-lysine N-methyltransferase SETMAR n=1 Tax=Eumeta variegata TaxID=151549 RepID=A0A4C1Z6W8_EUMVA|nr:hypothetical protein EVAR_64601_1 [Eumeta japonica]
MFTCFWSWSALDMQTGLIRCGLVPSVAWSGALPAIPPAPKTWQIFHEVVLRVFEIRGLQFMYPELATHRAIFKNHGASKIVYNINKDDESWIHGYDPETKQQSTVRVFQDEPNPTKVIRVKSTLKTILHNDDASCHTSAQTTRFLEDQKIKLTGHPPYSSDLAPNDFYLFPSV